jgi:hypothetical protein
MKTIRDDHKPLPVHPLSTPRKSGKGGGRGEKCKTTIQALPGKKPNWRCGAPAGNRNAAKPVIPLSTIRARLRQIRRRMRFLVAQAEREMAEREMEESGQTRTTFS